jgi:hypothetical protein
MSRVVRRSVVVAALALAALPVAASGSGAQTAPNTTITVRKLVVGTAAGPSTVTVSCQRAGRADAPDDPYQLGFDAHGNPTTSTPTDDFVAEDGAWVMHGAVHSDGMCTFTELDTGGALATAWTCEYVFTSAEAPDATAAADSGCDADAGPGSGPVTVTYQAIDVESDDAQASTVVFTNDFTVPLTPLDPGTLAPTPLAPAAAAALVVQPSFTG